MDEGGWWGTVHSWTQLNDLAQHTATIKVLEAIIVIKLFNI